MVKSRLQNPLPRKKKKKISHTFKHMEQTTGFEKPLRKIIVL